MRQESYRLLSILSAVAVSFLVLIASSGASGVSARQGAVVPALECPSCDDSNPCTVDSCDTTTGTCRHEALSCDDGNSCTADSCVLSTTVYGQGGCQHDALPAGTTCNDGLVCTTGDICNDSGACVGQIEPAGSPCDDGNSCTGPDLCDAAGACVSQGESAPGTPCDDGSECTLDDVCVSTASGGVSCQGVAKTCDDGDRCTRDTCDPATGDCGAAPIDCDDGNACTIDACDPATGACTRGFADGPCSDGNFCTTGDTCSGGNCIGTTRDCTDGVTCTTDVCVNDPNACRHVPVPSQCDDHNPCTLDTCDAVAGCVSTPVADGTSCDTNGTGDCRIEECSGGQCVVAQVAPPGQPCDDNNPCTTADVCGSGGVCSGQPACNDGNPCTADACDPVTGACTNAPITGSCNDQSACTTADACVDGFCQGAPVDCDDHKDCTLDSCDPRTGCIHFYDARLPDSDSDGIPNSCDNCPAAANHFQYDCNANGIGDACDPSLYNLSIMNSSKGSAFVLWSTVCETDVRGFNVVLIDNQGRRTQLNPVAIPCTECVTGAGASYATFLPKHKSGRNVFLEVLYKTSVNLTVGPATHQ